MEWVIVDDGSDKIEDLVGHLPYVRYFKYDEKMTLGKKRNISNEKAKGDIIVYMDDDDYYPPERVKHAVERLQESKALCAGSSAMFLYFKHINKMFQFGPYGPNHATAGTFAFKRELLKDHRYEDHAALAEEKAFLKNYSVPFVQLEPKKTILVFSHIHNTFDKKKLLEQGENDYQKTSPRTVDEFVKDPEMRQFYMEKIDGLFQNYKPGDPSNKPDVLKQIKEIEEERKSMSAQQNGGQGQIVLNQNGQQIVLNNDQIVQIIQKQQEQLQHFAKMLEDKDKIISSLESQLEVYKIMNEKNNSIIQLLQKTN
jgi:glycosyltransferase involved in cell wall biosynthesis